MLSILIVNWNTREMLCACLHSIQSHCAELEYEVIVVDNASGDGSAEAVRAHFPSVILIESQENLGFADGNNRALEMARGQWVWLLNPDTQIFPDAAQSLIGFLQENPRVGAVASALLDARDGRIQRSCRTFPTPAALWTQASGMARLFARSRRFGFYKMGWWNYKTARAIEQPMASSLMLRREAIEKIGGLFNPLFPIFFNDVELCWRLWQNGWEIWFEPRSQVLHWGGAATSQLKPQMVAESHRCLRLFYELAYRNKIPFFIYHSTLILIRLSGWARLFYARRKMAKQRGASGAL